jgi:putative membrane protein
VSEERQTDTQAELANERTYLAWLRTGLALLAVGVAAERVLPAEGIIWARQLIGYHSSSPAC